MTPSDPMVEKVALPIVERLRELATFNREKFPRCAEPDFYALGDEAADTIEELRAALAETHNQRAELVEALTGMVRLSEMGLEESLNEPEENGNYAAFNRAKALLTKIGSAS